MTQHIIELVCALFCMYQIYGMVTRSGQCFDVTSPAFFTTALWTAPHGRQTCA